MKLKEMPVQEVLYYGKEELTAPKRVVTSTVKIKNALDKRMSSKN